MTKLLSYLLPALLMIAPALAQTRYCIGGDLAHLSHAQRASCEAQLRSVRELAAELQADPDWHFVLVCDEQGWSDYVSFAANGDPSLLHAPALNDFEGHETFIQAAELEASSAPALRASLLTVLTAIKSYTQAHHTVLPAHAAVVAS